MVDNFDDDLFKHTTMTFGEHLEELRSSLFKAVIALAIGFGIGLYYGDWVVRRIQDPLVGALTKYFVDQEVEEFKLRLKEREARGEHIPEVLKDPENITRLIQGGHDTITGEGLLYDEVYIMPGEILKELKDHYPKTFKDIELPDKPQEAGGADGKNASLKQNMIRIFLWHAIKDDQRLKVRGLNAQEAFMIWLKASFLTGAIIASPFIFWFLWNFVGAGLYPHERRYVNVFLPFSLLLFLSGAALAFFFVFPPVLNFFFSFNKMLDIEPDPRISEWLSFVLLMPLGFGVSFQLPLVMLFLQRIGVFDVTTYLAKWRIAILVMAVASMVLSPGGDPYSMMMMLVPLIVLYFGGVALCKWLPANRNPFDAA